MSTSDQQGHGPLTRKQLREIRLTGSTPVISPEEAAAAAEAAPPAPPLPAEEEHVEAAPASVSDDAPHEEAAPLTRRQAREQERIKTASVPVVGDDGDQPADEVDHESSIGHETAETQIEDVQVEEVEETEETEEPSAIVSGIPAFSAPAPTDTAGDDDDLEDEIVVEPVSASGAADAVGAVPLEIVEESADDDEDDDVDAVLGLSPETESEVVYDEDVLADVDDRDGDDVVEDPRPTVNPAFGEGVLTDAPDPHAPFRPSFDELLTVGDSTGSQHSAPSALIFTPSPGEGSLSGPVASTGEILVTGSYELPRGLGSQGHAHGTTDGKDIDSVLIDGELPPASSPTPIAASAAVSTIKPAGEVIRPPAPEKGNKLLLILTIVAGGLFLAVGVAVVIAFSTNVF